MNKENLIFFHRRSTRRRWRSSGVCCRRRSLRRRMRSPRTRTRPRPSSSQGSPRNRPGEWVRQSVNQGGWRIGWDGGRVGQLVGWNQLVGLGWSVGSQLTHWVYHVARPQTGTIHWTPQRQIRETPSVRKDARRGEPESDPGVLHLSGAGTSCSARSCCCV